MEIKYQLEPRDFEALRTWAHGGSRSARFVRTPSGGEAMSGPASLVTSTDGLRATAPGGPLTAAWSKILGYGETADHVFVVIDGAFAMIIPKRNQSPEDLAALITEIQRYKEPPPSRHSPVWYMLRTVALWVLLLFAIVVAWHFVRGLK